MEKIEIGTIMNIIDAIENDYPENDENILITHDAVRPFLTVRIIEENIESALKYGASDTVIPATDTIVKSVNNETITDIPDRSELYQGQTPQTFKIGILKSLYNELTVEEKAILTDACKICVLKKQDVYLVNGDSLNIKITTMSDYTIAQAILSKEEE